MRSASSSISAPEEISRLNAICGARFDLISSSIPLTNSSSPLRITPSESRYSISFFRVTFFLLRNSSEYHQRIDLEIACRIKRFPFARKT